MAGDKRKQKDVEVVKRQEEVASLYLRQMSQQEIAEALGVSQQTISNDLAAIKRRWQQQATIKIESAKAAEIARINLMESQYWKAWDASRGNKETTKSKRTDATETKAEVQVERESQTGDPRYLEGVRWCIEKRIAIFGLNMPIKAALTDPDGKALKLLPSLEKAAKCAGLDITDILAAALKELTGADRS